MTLLLWLLGGIAGLAALLFVLAQTWARTPHGRLEPIFALLFRLSALRPSASRGLGLREVEGPAEVAKIRADFEKDVSRLSRPVAFPGAIEDRELPGPGGALPVRIYRPPPSSGGPLPLLVYFHGGGFVLGSPAFTDGVTRLLAATTPAVVVSVDYRMAPEHPFPAAVEDCDFAVGWCFENAAALGARTGPVAVAGDSAGGNLAAVVAQRDQRGGRGRIGLQALIYPWLDLSRTDRGSHVAFFEGYGLGTRDLEDCIRLYVPAGADRTHPDLSPLHAKSLAGLAPTRILTAGFDVLRDEGIAYAGALAEAGVEVRHVNETALPHGFITMSRVCRQAQQSLRAIAEDLRGLAGARAPGGP